MKKGRFLWSAHRITEKPKAGKARNIKEKQLKNSRNTVWKQLVELRSSANDNLQLKNAKKARKYAIFRAFSMPKITWFRWWNLRKFDFKLAHVDGFAMGLQKAILEGKIAPYPWQIFGKNPAEMEWKTVSGSFGEFWRILQKNNIRYPVT